MAGPKFKGIIAPEEFIPGGAPTPLDTFLDPRGPFTGPNGEASDEYRAALDRAQAQAERDTLEVDMSRFHVRRVAANCSKRIRDHHPDTPEAMRWVWEILVVLEVLDIRGTGELIQVRLVKEYPSHFPQERLPREARKAVLDALSHEVDECLHIDGKRLGDPHPEVKPWAKP